MSKTTRLLARILFDVSLVLAFYLILVFWPFRHLRRLFRGQQINSLWVGTPIINMATNAKAERLLGVNAKSLVYSTYFITDSFDYDLSTWSRIPLFGKLLPLFVFLWACYYADRLHFYCDRGILPSRGNYTFDISELYIYRILSIPVFFWTYGADIRNQQSCIQMGEPNCCTFCDKPNVYCICDQQIAYRNLNRLKSLSVAVFAGIGDMFNYTPGSRNDLFFWPVDLAAEQGELYYPSFPSPSYHSPFIIVHSSNHRRFKGTNFLIEAVEDLKKEGLDLDLLLVERVPNREALTLYRSADLIFDQCLMGNLGYFALEAMALGKPVMCFIRHPQLYLLHPDECPIINTHVSTLRDDLRAIIFRRHELESIGRRGRSYVERYFSLNAFALRLSAAYKDYGIMK